MSKKKTLGGNVYGLDGDNCFTGMKLSPNLTNFMLGTTLSGLKKLPTMT